MKKLGVMIISAICIMISVSMISSVSAAGGYIRGDADGDGIVIIDDVTTIQMVLAELESDETGIITMCGDVDGNGLDISDATQEKIMALATRRDGQKGGAA